MLLDFLLLAIFLAWCAVASFIIPNTNKITSWQKIAFMILIAAMLASLFYVLKWGADGPYWLSWGSQFRAN